MPSRLRSSAGASSATATSQRLMNSDATDGTDGSSPASIRRSTPRMNASAAPRYCSRENSSVTLIGTPAKIDSSIAVRPASVPGILMYTLQSAFPWSSRAWSIVASASSASSGETSSETQPSTSSVRLLIGSNSSAARRRSVSASSKNSASPSSPPDASSSICSSYA